MHEKEIEKLQAKKEKVERQLAQEQHKIQRLENRAAYYEKGNRRKRAHRLITRGCCRLPCRGEAAQCVLRRGQRLHPQGRRDLL